MEIPACRTTFLTECSITQLCPTLGCPVDCSPPGCSVHGIFQARILEWVAISYSGDLHNPGIEKILCFWHLLHWQADSSPLAPPGKHHVSYCDDIKLLPGVCSAPVSLLPVETHPVHLTSPTSRALRQVELRLWLQVPRVGQYIIMVEYASEAEQLSEAAVHVQSPGADLAGRVDIYSCEYR